MDLDQIDRHLVSLLQNNSRESAANLARKLDLARTTVVSRIARLEREGFIAGYGIRLGRRIEESAIRVYCGLRVAPNNAGSIVKALARFSEVQEVCSVSGQFDYLISLHCDTTQKLDSLLDHIGQIQGILETHTSVVLSKKLDRRAGVEQ